jgi:hypothetical protein
MLSEKHRTKAFNRAINRVKLTRLPAGHSCGPLLDHLKKYRSELLAHADRQANSDAIDVEGYEHLLLVAMRDALLEFLSPAYPKRLQFEQQQLSALQERMGALEEALKSGQCDWNGATASTWQGARAIVGPPETTAAAKGHTLIVLEDPKPLVWTFTRLSQTLDAAPEYVKDRVLDAVVAAVVSSRDEERNAPVALSLRAITEARGSVDAIGRELEERITDRCISKVKFFGAPNRLVQRTT